MVDRQDDDFEPEYHTREEAIRIARAESERALKEEPESISYVCYVPGFYDYCLCEFVLGEGGWVKTMRGLTPGERLPAEEIQDERIRELAHSGNMVSAIRLYRSKYQVGLREAYDVLNLLLQESRK